jgi:cytochrome c oxidase cbb3-type subunit 3
VQEVLGAPGRVEAGRDLFERECRQCHTGDGQPGAAPSIEHPQVLSLAGDRFLLETIMYGRSNTAMPAWSHLTAAEFASLIRFLRSRSPSRPSIEKGAEPRGDPERGARLFSSCTRCHGKEGRGGIGPAIPNPDFLRSVTPEFLQSTIRSGRSHTAMFGWEGALAGSASAPDGGVEDVVAYLLSRRDEVTDRVHPGESVGRPAQGKEFYASRCSECHGGAGEGIAAPALNNQEFLNAGSNGFLLATITLGRRGTGMPSWGRGDSLHHSLTLQERQDLVAFIRLWQRRVIRTADGIQARAAVPER